MDGHGARGAAASLWAKGKGGVGWRARAAGRPALPLYDALSSLPIGEVMQGSKLVRDMKRLIRRVPGVETRRTTNLFLQ